MWVHPFTACLISLAFLATPAWTQLAEIDTKDLVPNPRQERTAQVILKVVEHHHYKKTPMSTELSQRLFDRYWKSLDNNRSFMTQTDIEGFAAYRERMGEILKGGKLEPIYSMFRLYRQRVDERMAKALDLLLQHFDFSSQEEYRFDRAEVPWPKDAAALDVLWLQRVKNDYLTLKVAGKSDGVIRDTLKRRYEGIGRRTRQINADDVFQIFINAYTQSVEPHTSYMSPSVSENFDISMRLSLEGIGAVLKSDDEFTQVQKIIPGGPAAQSGQLHASDRIVGVAQGRFGSMEDVVGWRLQDVVEKIRGPKKSLVRLQVQPKGGAAGEKFREIVIERNEIKLEEQAAKKSLLDNLPGLEGLKIGVIEIPTFYRDFRGQSKGQEDFRSTTRDVRQLLEELKRDRVDGIVIDLRDNGGGSLAEATELTGLFIDEGPVVQVRSANGKLDLENDPEPGTVYDGPLGVLVNRESASASEIFSGAIQDYRRGLVLGETTFGKGTVQTLLDINRLLPKEDKDFGRLRLTMAQFFRVSGDSTQHRGVVPDIGFPGGHDSDEEGERTLDNALPWAHISPAHYAPLKLGSIEPLKLRSAERVKADSGFALLTQREVLLKELDKHKVVSLNETRRRQESEQREKLFKDQKSHFLKLQGVTVPDEDDNEDTEAKKDEQNAIKHIGLDESARILADAIRLNSPAVAAHAAMAH
ncbi:MAG: carboxy terminal-processing peptidase [Pseudomonadota bacterium]